MRSWAAGLGLALLAVQGAQGQEDSGPDSIDEIFPNVRGQKTVTELLQEGYEIVDYELVTIRVNRFQAQERALLVKGASLYSCTFRVERNERTNEPEKVSICVPVR